MKLFFRVFYWFVLRHAIGHCWRVSIVVAGIALGAAVFTSVRISVNASVESFAAGMNRFAGTADAVLVRPGGLVPNSVMGPLLKHPAVEAAAPVSTAYVECSRDGCEPFLLIGIDPLLEAGFRAWRTEKAAGTREPEQWTQLLSSPAALLAAPALMQRLGLEPGRSLSLVHLQRSAEFTVIGGLSGGGPSRIEGGRMAVADIAAFQEFTGRLGGIDRIDLKWRSSADPASVEAILPPGVVLRRPAAAKESGMQFLQAYRLNLSILSFVSLFVGMFLVYSLVALHGASRRRELSILRSMGAPRRMLFFLFLGEGAVFGVLGWVAAVPLGAALVRYLLEIVNRTISTLFVRVHVDRLLLDPWEILLSFAVTLAMAVLGALLPAREAMRVSPKEVLAQAPSPHGGRTARRLALGGLAAVALVLPIARIPGPPGLPVPGYAATFLLFAGFSLLAPWILEQMGRFLPAALRRIGGEPARLAGRYLKDSGIRAAVSVAALITAVALFCALTIMVYSFRSTVQTWVRQSISGDLFIRPKMAELNRYRDPMPEAMIRKLKHLDAPVDLAPYHRIYLDYGGVPVQFETVDVDTFFAYGSFLWVAGDPASAMESLRRGKGALVSEVFANRTGLRPGDRFRIAIRAKTLKLAVAGVVRDYRTRGGVVFYSLSRFEERFAAPWDGVRIFFRHRGPTLEAAADRLRSRILAMSEGGIEVASGRRLRETILQIFDETFAVTFVLLIIALAVAALGIASTLAVLVLERKRQFNTIRAVGGSAGQIRAVIFWEALLMTAAGQATGLLCGFLLSYLLIFVINRQSFGWTFLYRIDWTSLGVAVPLILAAALAVSLPAVRLIFAEPPATLLREK